MLESSKFFKNFLPYNLRLNIKLFTGKLSIKRPHLFSWFPILVKQCGALKRTGILVVLHVSKWIWWESPLAFR